MTNYWLIGERSCKLFLFLFFPGCFLVSTSSWWIYSYLGPPPFQERNTIWFFPVLWCYAHPTWYFKNSRKITSVSPFKTLSCNCSGLRDIKFIHRKAFISSCPHFRFWNDLSMHLRIFLLNSTARPDCLTFAGYLHLNENFLKDCCCFLFNNDEEF